VAEQDLIAGSADSRSMGLQAVENIAGYARHAPIFASQISGLIGLGFPELPLRHIWGTQAAPVPQTQFKHTLATSWTLLVGNPTQPTCLQSPIRVTRKSASVASVASAENQFIVYIQKLRSQEQINTPKTILMLEPQP
jgi:hypothetical protein